jgi:glucans biosynthesis protein C
MQKCALDDRPGRRYDIDWLRIAAVLLLIPYHTARVFNYGEDFYAKNKALSMALSRLVVFLGPWHMSLLFFLAGASSWFALGFRSGGRYAGERLRRLLVPFIFGLIVLIPPQGYIGMLTNTRRDLSYWGEYKYFWTHATDLQGYDGAWTPGHLWFILFLFIYSMLGLGLFLWMRRGGGRRLISGFAAACRIPGLVLLVPALILMGLQLLPMDDQSGQNFVTFFVLVVLGFVVVADDRITAAVARHWPWALAVGIAGMGARTALYPGYESWPRGWGSFLLGVVIYEAATWSMIVGLLGLCHRYVDRGTPVAYPYAAQAAYPFYILHQTVIVSLAYLIVQWGIGIPLKFALIAAASFAVTLAIYEIAVRRWGPVRFVFGVKPARRVGGGRAPGRGASGRVSSGIGYH